MQDRQDLNTVPAITSQRSVILPVQAGDVRWSDGEPALSDMLADPITRMLMHRDGVEETEIRRLAARLRNAAAPARWSAANDLSAD